MSPLVAWWLMCRCWKALIRTRARTGPVAVACDGRPVVMVIYDMAMESHSIKVIDRNS